MGINVVNAGDKSHGQPGWTENEYVLYYHFEAAGIDTKSLPFGQGAMNAIRTAAVSGTQAAFDAACASATAANQWYVTPPCTDPVFRNTLRETIKRRYQ